MPASAATEPTDRSIPAVRITNVFGDGDQRDHRGLNADVEQVVRGEEYGEAEAEVDEDDDERTGCGELGDNLGKTFPHGRQARAGGLASPSSIAAQGSAVSNSPAAGVIYRVVVGGVPNPGTVMVLWVIATRAPRTSATVSMARMSATMTRRLLVLARCAGGRRGHS